MRSLIRLTLASVAVTAVACGRGKTTTASMSDDLKRELQLATSQTQNLRVSPDELTPQSHQELALKPKKAPGPKVIHTEHPTVMASHTPTEVAEIPTEIPQVQAMATAPTESETSAPSAPATARPAQVAMPTYPGPGASTGTASGGEGTGSVIGAVLGGIFGAVIRGGAVGDDHCDPRTDGRRGGGGIYGPRGPGTGVYAPRPSNTPIVGGMGGMRGRPRR